ncbi:MAG: PD-(D/E)XK nuclease family protein [Vicinamibacterales bacterium]
MSPPAPFPIVVSTGAEARLARAAAFLDGQAPGTRVVIVGASRGAADELARRLAVARPATFGLERLSLAQLAVRIAAPWMAAHGLTPASALGLEAVAARTLHDVRQHAPLDYLEPVAATPGFARALASTFRDLDAHGSTPDQLGRATRSGADLARLLGAHAAALTGAGTVSLAAIMAVAATRVAAQAPAEAMVLLDVPVTDDATERLVTACVASTPSVLATCPAHDVRTQAALARAGGARDALDDAAETALTRLRRHLFRRDTRPPAGAVDDSLQIWSAPGEAREAIEIARRLLDEARRGVPFDEMAVLLRSPQAYAALLEHACRRAGVPIWSERGAQRPDAAGRAWLALLSCGAEGLPASRFAEYLSLGQVPRGDAGGVAPVRGDDPFGRDAAGEPGTDDVVDGAADAGAEADPLRAPWRWDRLLVDAAVIGGDPARWRRRLDGLAASLDLQARDVARREGDPDAPQAQALEAVRAEVLRLTAFAVPVIETLASWPREARWGEWLAHFDGLAPRVLRNPDRVQRVCAELRPMAGVGPVTLDDVRRVLAARLSDLQIAPPGRRYGRVFVGTPDQARGRRFRVVFLPGLAERVFPQRPREDPLLLDEGRAQVSARLPQQEERLADERGRLHVAAGAATERLSVSYPRIEVGEGRARVPSLYALEVIRAATGRLPPHESLEAWARAAGQARLGWPAPADPARAIDDQEHDLAVLRPLLDSDPALVRGHAHYLLRLNDALRRSVVDRWSRGGSRWSPQDGLVRTTPATAPLLEANRLTRRPYSLSALQRYATCPYQFLLAGVLRLQPRLEPAPLDAMDPLTRGSLVHDAQARALRRMQADGLLPLTAASAARARVVLDESLDDAGDEYRDRLAPAVERVWTDALASIRRDLHGWFDQLAADAETWAPAYVELGFGQVPGVRDPHSVASPVTVGAGFQLRGAVDLVDTHVTDGSLRVTDHKTGRVPDGIAGVTVGGGTVLQPVLYAMAVEQVLGKPVVESRLSYCTNAGGYYVHQVPLIDLSRRSGVEVLTVIDRAIASGVLPPAPRPDACSRCDFTAVCGPDAARRAAAKPAALIADLAAVRMLP